MALFPTIWELLIPNLNIFTVIGVLAIILGVLGFVFLSKLDVIIPGDVKVGSIWLIVIGLFLIFGISFVQDLLGTMGGWIVVGVLVIIGLIILLIKDSDKKPGF